MPVWGAVVLAVAVATITQIGALTIQHLRLNREDRKSSREEWYRNLRWAADHIAKDTESDVVIGVRALDALDDDPGLNMADQSMIDAILKGITEDLGASESDSSYDEGTHEPNGGDRGDPEAPKHRQ